MGADVELPALSFTGQYLDVTSGLYHLQARQYDPTTGRFLSRDPLTPKIHDPYAATYAYVANNPILWTDPSGAVRERQDGGGDFLGITGPFDPYDPAFRDPGGRLSFWPFEGCNAATLGFGLGLLLGGAALDVASATATAVSAGTLTWLTAAGMVSGTSSVITGVGLIDAAC